ncbi:MAG: acyl-CoA reductase [Verrucomicrobiota bacterium]
MAKILNTKERINLIASTFPSLVEEIDVGFSSAEDLKTFLEAELGSIDVLESFVSHGTAKKKAIVPENIYHVCASNLDVSALTSLVIGLLLGSKLTFKLPSSDYHRFTAVVEKLDPSLRDKVLLIQQHETDLMNQADAVVVFGSDETIASLHSQAHWRQRFLGYGHKLSFGLIPETSASELSWSQRAVMEISAYQQLGCLSPQAYFVESKSIDIFTANLVEAFKSKMYDLADDFNTKAAIYMQRQEFRVSGVELITPGDSLQWTIIKHNSIPRTFVSSPGYRFIQLIPFASVDVLNAFLATFHNNLSALSIATEGDLGLYAERMPQFKRYCKTGHLQMPPLTWLHDGRPRLADLISWKYLDA